MQRQQGSSESWAAPSAVWASLKAGISRVPKRWLVVSGMVVLTALAVFLRCLHLLSHSNYFVVSPDSYFFHWVAAKVMAGAPPPTSPGAAGTFTFGSGLSFPLAYIGKAVSYVFGLSSAQALTVASKALPPFLGVVGLILVYVAASRIINRRVGIFAAFTWGFMFLPVFYTAAGYLDRDGLSNLLLMIGAFIFLLSKGWHFRIRGKDVGWLLAGLGILVVEGLLYAEWKLHGPLLLLGILVVYLVVATMLGYIVSARKEQSSACRLRTAFEDANGRIFAVVLFGNIVALALNVDKFSSWFSMMTSLMGMGGQARVSEMQGLSLASLVPLQLFVIPMVLGIYVAYKKGGNGAVFFTCWFLSFLVLSLWVGRVLNYAIAAACLLSGIGLDFLWQWSKSARYSTWRRAGVWALLGLPLVIAFSMVPSYAANPLIAVDEQWQGALTYIRDSTPQDAVVMTQWSWGYAIIDLGNRTPVVDNGYHNHTADQDRDVALVYMATEPSEAVRIMKKYGADYLIFSKPDLDDSQAILSWAGLDKQYDTFPKESLVIQCLEGGFQGGGGLQVVYRSTPDSEVVILGLTSS